MKIYKWFMLLPLLFIGATTIDDNLTITMDNITYHGGDLGVIATFQYTGESNGYHNWRLTSLTNKQSEYTEFDLQLQSLINEYRRSLGLNDLIMVKIIWDECLEHNINMENGVVPFGHDGFMERINDIRKHMPVGYAVENAGMGYRTPEQQFSGWYNSPGHKVNMEHPSLTHMGVSKYGNYTTFLAIQSW